MLLSNKCIKETANNRHIANFMLKYILSKALRPKHHIHQNKNVTKCNITVKLIGRRIQGTPILVKITEWSRNCKFIRKAFVQTATGIT